MLRYLANAFLALTWPIGALAQDFDTLAANAAKAAPDFALGVAYGVDSEAPVTKTFGTIHKSSTQEVAPDAPWHIGSITKSFTATLILRLVERGMLSLDAPIKTYLKADSEAMHEDWQNLTLRQLLSHSSGLAANPPKHTFQKRETDEIHKVRQQVLGTVWTAPVSDTPGRYAYSNLGYVLAGYVAEAVTGHDWEDLIRAEIAKPLGLRTLGFGAPRVDGAAWGHRNRIILKTPVPPDGPISDNPPWLGPAGTIHLGLADLVRWGQIHLKACRGEAPEFLSAALCREMQTAVAGDYGLGWVITKMNTEPDYLWHNGSNTMWYTLLMMVPEDDVVLVASTNVFQTNQIDKLLDALRRSKLHER